VDVVMGSDHLGTSLAAGDAGFEEPEFAFWHEYNSGAATLQKLLAHCNLKALHPVAQQRAAETSGVLSAVAAQMSSTATFGLWPALLIRPAC
jgi:hypothetical protein